MRMRAFVLGLACLLPSIAMRTAAAGEKLDRWKEEVLDDLTKAWPDRMQGDRIRSLHAEVERRLGEAQSWRLASGEEKPTADELRFLVSCSAELERFRDALLAFAPAYTQAAEIVKAIVAVEAETGKLLAALVDRVSGKKEDVVRDGFDGLARDSRSTRDAFRRDVAAVEARLAEGPSWRAAIPLFAPVDAALDARSQQVVHTVQDAYDRVFEDGKPFQAALAGETGVLCELCLAGNTEEALKYLRTWQPPKLVHAQDLKVAFELPAESGWIDVVAHGGGGRLYLKGRDGKDYVGSAKVVFEMVKRKLRAEDLSSWARLNDDLSIGIRLLSCESGSDPLGIAQQLANVAGVPVKAPDDILWFLRKGGQTQGVIHSCEVCRKLFEGDDRPAWLIDHVAAATKRGAWKTFQPANGAADAEVRDLLYDLAKAEPWWQVYVTGVKLTRKPAEVIEALQRLGAKQKDAELAALLTGKDDFVLVDGLTRAQAIAKATEASRLGLKARGEPMGKYKLSFKGIKTD